MKKIFISNNREMTIEFAAALSKHLHKGDLITLNGELGAGKTTFTKGFAKGLGITRPVTSPTFTIIKEYLGTEMPLYHMDAYRLEDSEEDIGFEEYFDGKGITVVEWSVFIDDFLPSERLDIQIEYLSEDERAIHLHAIGVSYEKQVKAFNLIWEDM